MPSYQFRKRFNHEFEADETAANFAGQYRRLTGLKLTLSKRTEVDGLYLYLIAEGDIPDPQEMADAMGYEYVTD